MLLIFPDQPDLHPEQMAVFSNLQTLKQKLVEEYPDAHINDTNSAIMVQYSSHSGRKYNVTLWNIYEIPQDKFPSTY